MITRIRTRLVFIGKLSLTYKFIIGSLCAILAIGAGTGFILVRQVRSQYFDEFARRTVIAQRTVVSHDLEKSDFDIGSTKLAKPAFDRMMQKTVISTDKDIRIIKIRRRDGTVLYSNIRSWIGRRGPVDDILARVFAGEVVVKRVVDPNDALSGQDRHTQMVEVYSPISFDGEIVAVFETHFPYSAVSAVTRGTAIKIAVILAAGLTILWLGLSWLIKGASTMIDRQHRQLHRVTRDQAETIEELREAYLGTMRALGAAVEARDPYTSGHSMRVTYLAYLLGKDLGMNEDELWQLQLAAALHDIGKIGTPDTILLKPGQLSHNEWVKIREHPIVGAGIVMATPCLKDTAPIVLHHHESWRGGGYPDGVGGDEIPLGARVLALADAFDAMTSDRPYRKAFSYEDALQRIAKGRGFQFDPEITSAFLSLCRREEENLKRVLCAREKLTSCRWDTHSPLIAVLGDWDAASGF